MTWLLDVSVLAAYLAPAHEHHRIAARWRIDRTIAVCPITELGYLRVACALGYTMDDARALLTAFVSDEAPLFIPCDRRVLDGPAVQFPRKTTDIYLADLAAFHGFRFATLDTRIEHAAVDVISESSVD